MKQKDKKQNLNCKFIRFNPDKEKFNDEKALNEIRTHLKNSYKKSLIENISKKLLESELNVKSFNKIRMFKPCSQKVLPTI